MEQIIESVTPMTDSKPITVTGRERPESRGISGVVFMQERLVIILLLAAVILNIADKDLLISLKDEFLRLTNKETEEIFVSLTDYIQSFLNV